MSDDLEAQVAAVARETWAGTTHDVVWETVAAKVVAVVRESLAAEIEAQSTWGRSDVTRTAFASCARLVRGEQQ